jgi:hypothetical protein
MSDELKFDVKKLQAMQVPLSVRAVAVRGDTQMPLNIPPGALSQNQAAGTGYTREEVTQLEQELGKNYGGGHYEIGVVDANGQDMKWRIMLAPELYPGNRKLPTAPPQIPMGSTPPPPQQTQAPQVPMGSLQVSYPQPGSFTLHPQPAQSAGWTPPAPPNIPGWPYPPPWPPPSPYPFWPPPPVAPPPQPNSNSETRQHEMTLMRMEFQQSLNTAITAVKDEFRVLAEKLVQPPPPPPPPKEGLIDVLKLAAPFAPQIFNYLANRPSKEDPATGILKEELRGLRESVQRQEERRAHDAERQQMMQAVEQVKDTTLRQLEELKASVQDRASAGQVGVLDRVIDAFRGFATNNPTPQGLQMNDIVSLMTLMKQESGKTGDLRETLGLFRELAESFSGGEPSLGPKVLDTVQGVMNQVIQAKAMQQVQRGPMWQPPPPVAIPQGTAAANPGLAGPPPTVPMPPSGLEAMISGAVHELRTGAQQFVDSAGKLGLPPKKAAESTRDAAERLRTLNIKMDLRTLFEEAKFGELTRRLFRISDELLETWQTYMDEYIATLEELTQMEAADYQWEEGEGEEEDSGEGAPAAAGKK